LLLSLLSGRSRSALKGTDTGAVFIFERTKPTDKYVLIQKLQGSNVKAYDRFGLTVSSKGR
jgi:hypothetical protein